MLICTHHLLQTYTVLLSWRINLLENSLKMSKNARLSGGLPSPWGLGSLKANSIPSLLHRRETMNEHLSSLKHTHHCESYTACQALKPHGLGPRFVTYLCNMAIASLVFNWSKPKVNEKRRASSLMPQKADDERSKLKPCSDNISLNNYKKTKINYWLGGFTSKGPTS